MTRTRRRCKTRGPTRPVPTAVPSEATIDMRLSLFRLAIAAALLAGACSSPNRSNRPDAIAPEAATGGKPRGTGGSPVAVNTGGGDDGGSEDAAGSDVPTPATDGPPEMEVEAPCTSGTHRCGSACVDDKAITSCGTGCTPCAAPTGGSATCDGVMCGATCPTGTSLCLGACIPPTQACQGMCPAGKHNCNGNCVADSDVANCGPDRCMPCAPPSGADATCDGKTCGFTCRTGRVCGNRCAADNEPCNGACVSGRKLCGNTCIPNSGCCEHSDCGRCQECASNSCRDQSAGQDKKNECGGKGCFSGACRVCTPNAGECTAAGFRKCNANGTAWGAPTVCDFGCAPTGCTACENLVTCYRDADKDGYGDAKDSKKSCGACETGYVNNKTDCFDANAMAYPRGPTTGFDDFFGDHRGDGSFDYTCDGRVETSPGDPEKHVCMGVGATCEIVRKDFDASLCGTLVPVVTCSCNDIGMGCMKSCRLVGAPGSKIQVKCR
jgi:hypothetical protein